MPAWSKGRRRMSTAFRRTASVALVSVDYNLFEAAFLISSVHTQMGLHTRLLVR